MGCGSSTVAQMETRGLVYIYYGTTSGNSSRLAFQFADQIKKLKFVPKVINLSEFQPELMISSRLNVFFVSTYGVGTCTSDAISFNEWIFDKNRTKAEFEQMSYMVFALGNTYHEHFCQFGITLDARLEELGAKRLINLGKGNAAEDTTEKDYEKWYQNGVEESVEEFFPLFSYEAGKFDFSSYKIITSIKPEIQTSTNLEYEAKRYCESKLFTIKEIRQLKKKPTFGNSTFYIDLSFEGLKYQTAGNIAIYPENSDQDITDLCNWLKLDSKRIFEIITKSKQPFPNPISVYHYLKKYCDFLGPITKKQLMELANLTLDKQINNEIIHAATFEGREIFEEKYLNKKENLLSLLKQYNIRQLTLEQLVEICPLIAPRYFTIASSSIKYPNNIHIVASELKLTETRAGLCSSYFKNLKQGHVLRGFLQQSSFTLPLNKKSPILLIGPGAGLAPMRALIQEKDHHLEKNLFDQCPLQGPMTLFFGCRTHDDILFEEELKEYYKNGTLNSLKMAFSRENPKEYVTDFMDLQMIQNHLNQDGVIYVCGSSNMGKDVTNKIEDMYKQLEDVQPYMAYKMISDLQEKKQLITEFWG